MPTQRRRSSRAGSAWTSDDPALLDEALVHSSYVNEHPDEARRLQRAARVPRVTPCCRWSSPRRSCRAIRDEPEGVAHHPSRRHRLHARAGPHRAAASTSATLPRAGPGRRALRGAAPRRRSWRPLFEALVAAVYLDQGLERRARLHPRGGRARSWRRRCRRSRSRRPRAGSRSAPIARTGRPPDLPRRQPSTGPTTPATSSWRSLVDGPVAGRGRGPQPARGGDRGRRRGAGASTAAERRPPTRSTPATPRRRSPTMSRARLSRAAPGRLQVLRGADRGRVRPGHHRRRRPQRQRQVATSPTPCAGRSASRAGRCARAAPRTSSSPAAPTAGPWAWPM